MKILCFTSRIPWPLEKGDKLRIYHQLKELSAHHEIILCAVHDEAIHKDARAELGKFCSEMHFVHHNYANLVFNLLRGFLKGMPLQVSYFSSAKAKKIFDRIVADKKPDRIYCQLIRTAEYVKGNEHIPATIDYMDVFSKGVQRRIDKVGFIKRVIFKMEWKRLLKYERDVYSRFKQHSIISQQDLELLPVDKKENITIIPNGVDTDFFKPLDHKKEFELLFNGNMNYPPNVESVIYIVKRILPVVWKTKSNVRLLISGATPANEVLQLASDKVIITGWVDDVRESFAKSKILVAPMQSSIGLQNKILEAMAMKLPCITTTLSNNAVKAIPDKQILVADTPEQFATYIHLLLDHPDKAQQLAENGYRLVQEEFNWKHYSLLLEKIITDAGN